MTTNRYRAGQPADLSHMLHRVNSIDLPDDRAAFVAGTYDEMPVQFAGPEPTETPLRARIMDAAADALDWVLDRLWVGAVGLVVVVCLLVWSLS